MTAIDDVRTNLELNYGPYCGECGIKWRNPSSACPRMIHNVHPLYPQWTTDPDRVKPSGRAQIAKEQWMRQMGHKPLAATGKRYPVTTICGSMRYYAEMIRVAQLLTERGQIVLMPHAVAASTSTLKQTLDDMHKRKIDMSVSITVVGAYQGESTNSEIEYARSTGKRVYAWTEHFGQCDW